jgi:transcriptional regulator with XRE-family HTH domain
MSVFSERLKEERKRLNLNQTDFGEIAGVGKEAQLHYEKGNRCPDADYLMAVAAAGVDVLYLLTGKRMSALDMALSADEADLVAAYRRADSHTPVSARQLIAKLASSLAPEDTSIQRPRDANPSQQGLRISIGGSVGQHVEGNATISAPQTFHVGSSKKQK